MLCCSLDLTQDMMMMSFSRPWNASTLLTSMSWEGSKGGHIGSHALLFRALSLLG